MALVERAYPTDLSTQDDFTAHKVLIEAGYFDQVNAPLLVRDGVIPQGVVLQIGSTVYEGTSDTAITGTASDYVKITPDGATAAAEYVSAVQMDGVVAWNSQYNGYYNAGATSLYIFDEGKALAASVVSTILTRYVSQQANGDVAIGRDLDVKRNAIVHDSIGVGGTATGAGSIRINKDGLDDGLMILGEGGISARIYRDDDTLHITRGTSSAIEIPANRNVGIGKTPTTKLDVDGDIMAVGDFRKSGQTGGVAGQNASATSGGAVGQNASATSGGAVGQNASATSGFAAGINASAGLGGAVGQSASATTGFAGGNGASANQTNAVALGTSASISRADEFSACNYYRGVRFASGTPQSTIRTYFSQYIQLNSSVGAAGAFGLSSVGRIRRESAAGDGDIIFYTNSDGLVIRFQNVATTTTSSAVVIFPVLG